MRASIVRLCAVALTAGALLAQHGYTPADIEEGQRLYGANCAQCHGPDGDALPGADLAHGKFRRASSDDELIQIVQKGIPGGAMPPNAINDLQAGAIVAYLRSVASKAAPGASISGDAPRGKAIFEGRGNCANCHRIGAKGSRMGPDLTDIGANRRAVQLEESMLDPDAEVLPQNRFVRVVMKDGASITGRLLNQDSYSIQMLDPGERLVTFQKLNLREYAVVEKSPMPSYKEKLNSQELADVVAYLRSLKGAAAQ